MDKMLATLSIQRKTKAYSLKKLQYVYNTSFPIPILKQTTSLS